ncbi:Ig-like domain-containing protein [Aeromonas sp. sia0103]|uniref:Ig-like domain-containing protein n=1 Tax=Aeromonas sp. sia0103 TaxID=2854782 RepID=UPI001C46BAE6|nr:Ig-like domain-containing protein [Aeromonas sp. sia0103]MBV7598292.1 Ig-like domain-containing protein [Aeromonas sp. sia0103]
MVSLQITPPQGRIPVTLTQQYVAQAVLSDGKVQDVTALGDVQWRSSDSAIATITSAGLATGVAPGRVTITASGMGANGAPVEAKAQLEVSNAQATGLQVTPPHARVAAGLNKQFTAILQLSDGTTLDVTHDLNWSSDDAGTATVAQGLASGVGAGMASLSASGLFQGKTVSGAAELTVSDATVTALQVTPAMTTTAIGLAQPFAATAVLSDGSSQVVTEFVSWSSTDTAIATVSNEQDRWGQARGLSVGSVAIMASGYFNGQDLSGTAQLKVSSATVTGLQLTPPRLRAPVGLPQQYSATAMLSDGSSQPVLDASWHSSEPGMATISAAGLATGAHAGTATLNASTSVNGQPFSGSAQLTVTDATVTALQVTPARGSVPIGLAQQYDATALMSDGTSLPMTDSASWVSDPLVATVDKGLASGVGVGTTDITATAVVNGVQVSNQAPLTVTGAEVTNLEVSPGIEAVPVGLSKAFTVRAWMSDGTSQEVTGNSNISWSSDDSGIATVDGSSGVATGVNIGPTYISAAGSINGLFLSDSASLAVGDAVVMGVEVTPDPATVPVGLSVQLTATTQLSDNSTQDITSTASWGSDDIGVATVIGGLTTGVSVGGANITATDSASGQSGSATLNVTGAVMTELAVTPKTATVSVGQDQQFGATATLSDGSSQDMTSSVSWSSGDLAVASIGSNTGLATGVAPGSSTITAMTLDGSGLSDTAELTVTAGCSTETLTDGAGKTWSCPLTQSKADADGIAYDGTFTENGISYALLTWPQASAYCTGLGEGYYLPLVAEMEALYDEFGNLEDYAGWPTNQSYWSATEGVNAGTHHLINMSQGSDKGPYGDTYVQHVTCAKLPPPSVVSLALTPATASIMEWTSQQYVATATLSNGETQVLSSGVAWSSSNTAVATVNSGGLATGVAIGNAVITATMQDDSSISATAQLEVVWDGLPDWTGCVKGMINAGGLTFTCPMTKEEAEALGIRWYSTYTEPNAMGENVTYILLTIENQMASGYCASLGEGFYLPSIDEVESLYDTYGNMEVYADWPSSKLYWSSTLQNDSSTGIDSYKSTDIAYTGQTYTNYATTPLLVTCARPAR